MRYFVWLSLLFLSACSSMGGGVLLQFDGQKGVDQSQLDRHCDMEDVAACLLKGEVVKEPTKRLPIVQGVAPPGRAVFAVMLEPLETVKWFLLERPALKVTELPVKRSLTRTNSLYRVERIEATELQASKTYELLAVDPKGVLLDHRKFRSLPESGLRFALVTGLDQNRKAEQEEQWNLLAAQSPDLIVVAGDSTFAADADDPLTLWNRYGEARKSLALFYQPQLVPLFATWNDQDYGMTAGNETYRWKDVARETFEIFFPAFIDAKMTVEGPGISRGLKVGGQTFLLLDNRTYRSPAEAPPEAEDTHLFGRIQETWLLGTIRAQEGPVWLVSGNQWLGTSPGSYEKTNPGSWGAFRERLKEATQEAAKSGRHPSLLFLSGTRDLSEIVKVKPLPKSSYETYEFTTSALHSETGPEPKAQKFQSAQKAAKKGWMAFTLLATSFDKNGALKVEATAHGLGGRTLYQRKFVIHPVVKPKPKKKRR